MCKTSQQVLVPSMCSVYNTEHVQFMWSPWSMPSELAAGLGTHIL